MDLKFSVKATWQGVGKEGEGELALGGTELRYSAPASMGGKGVGASPEDLLLSAVTACYSGTLMRILAEKHLPAASVHLETEGVVENFPEKAKFAQITVNPTIHGGDAGATTRYREAAELARERCFIGRTVRDYLTYCVGEVVVK